MPRKLPKMKTPVEIRQEQEKKMTFSDRWEEELKKQLFEEDNSEKETITAEDVLLSKTTIHKKRPGEEWDVPLSEEIQYFDPELSYELTGYKPINKTKGLDFDPSWFTEARETYEKTGKYCAYLPGSKKFREFWKEQYKRCKYGMTINGYTITGFHYFFLNYYTLPLVTKV